MSAPNAKPHANASMAAARIMRTASILVAVPSSIATGMVYGVFQGSEHNVTYELQTGLLMAGAGWISAVLASWVNARTLAMALVFSVQAIAIYMVITFGSIRAAESVLFLATVAAAGVFLSRRALLVSLLTSVTALGAATYAEIAGLLKPLANPVNATTWFTHAAVLFAVASIVLYARLTTRKVYRDRIEALEENKRLAQERDHSLEHFTRIFRTNPSPMVAQVATTGKIIDVNPAFERCYGYTKQAVLGKTDVMLWAKPEQREKHMHELKRDKRAEQHVATAVRSDGSQFEGHIRSELGSESVDSLVITTITDMTEQNLTLIRLRRSEERFSKAFNLSPLDLAITRQSDDAVVEINRSEDGSNTEPLSDPIGLPASKVGPWFSSADREVFMGRLKMQGYLHGYEATLVRPNGSSMDAKVWAEQIEIDEEACILTCIVDTSAEKRRETMLRDIASGMNGHTAQAFFGVLTQHMSHALGADMVFVGELSPPHTIQTIAASKNGRLVPNFSFSIADKLCEKGMDQFEPLVLGEGLKDSEKWKDLDDDTCYEATICQALHDIDGKPIGLLNALWLHPITPSGDVVALMAIFASRANAELLRLRGDRKIEHLNETLEQRVHERTAELSKLNAELDSFAYSISHDLKSPLRAIDGFTQLLSERLESRLEPEEQHLMARVLSATHRMATLMADLLALARVSQVPLRRERLNLSELAARVCTNLARDPSWAKVRWQVEPGVYGNGDEELTRTVLEHLIGNAFKYTRDQASPLVEFGQMQGSEEAAPVFFVRDNGAGFSMAHKDKLFKPFQRLHMPDAGFDGTGIGLATVRRIVERHGGSISGEARVNLGAEFSFSLGDSKSTDNSENDAPERLGVSA
ncbi:hypothetical protein LPB72_01435 [Hydrogenophaga crassostreae]|uniref:histidine kinase n=1 Tax=Hydrogenophaga crassostreae TaxID=1763535 RepID=A0A162PE81_9BURK|nr:PAS domain S-box protein [Hydrogenophaga crassostreae]AOW13851.1 hypothetical protein LPB072_14380 [Hydrogenophaga crassostreae]OAD44187.1 hypothetical protein LPB72_01435 [Hydrogenophaga crassostreae]